MQYLGQTIYQFRSRWNSYKSVSRKNGQGTRVYENLRSKILSLDVICFRSFFNILFDFWKCVQAKITSFFLLSFPWLFNLRLKAVSLLPTYCMKEILHWLLHANSRNTLHIFPVLLTSEIFKSHVKWATGKMFSFLFCYYFAWDHFASYYFFILEVPVPHKHYYWYFFKCSFLAWD